MKEELSICIPHMLRYNFDDPLTVKELIASLDAYSKIATHSLPSVLSILHEVNISRVEVFVEGLEEGCFEEHFLFKFFFEDKAEYDKCTAKFRGAFHKTLSTVGADKVFNTTVGQVTVGIVMIALISGATYHWATSSSSTANPAEVLKIEANNNIIINIGAESYGTSPAEFLAIIRDAIQNNPKKMVHNAAAVLAPAKRRDGGTLDLGDEEVLADIKITRDAIDAAPELFEYTPREHEETYKDAVLEIRATDRDSSNQGWAGSIPNVVNSRVKVVLADGINLEKLATQKLVRVDAVVLYRIDDAKKKPIPKLITVTAIIPEL